MRTKMAPARFKRCKYKVLAVKISEDIERESVEHCHRTAFEGQTV